MERLRGAAHDPHVLELATRVAWHAHVHEVHSCAEALARTGDHQHAVVGVGRDVTEDAGQLAPHRAGDRVQRVGAVQREAHHPALAFHEQFRHGGYRTAVGLNPFRAQQKNPTDIVIVVGALVVVVALVLWAVFG